MSLLAVPGFAKGGRGGSHRGGHSKVSKSKGKSGKTKGSKSAGSGYTNPDVVHVSEYTKKNGEHVKAHDRTAPNSTEYDNWSTKGNINPETSKKGTKEPNH